MIGLEKVLVDARVKGKLMCSIKKILLLFWTLKMDYFLITYRPCLAAYGNY